MAEHHVPESLLLEYAAGVADEAESLLVACHLTFCPECRAKVEQLEGLGGLLMSGLEGSGRELSVEPDSLAEPESIVRPTDPIFPTPLVELVGPSSKIPWRSVFPGSGVFEMNLPLAHGEGQVRLVRARAGAGVPEHTHRGRELDLVLQGGLRDHARQANFEPGDVQAADESVTHKLTVLPGEDCILLAVNEARVAPRGLWSRLVYSMLGW